MYQGERYDPNKYSNEAVRKRRMLEVSMAPVHSSKGIQGEVAGGSLGMTPLPIPRTLINSPGEIRISPPPVPVSTYQGHPDPYHESRIPSLPPTDFSHGIQSKDIARASNAQTVQPCIACPPPPQEYSLMNCNVVSPGNVQFDHRFVSLNRPFTGANDEPIYVHTPNGVSCPTQSTQARVNKITPHFQNYNEDLFKMPVMEDTRESMGIMVNSNSGEVFEAFQEQMPPPTTDKGRIAPGVLQKTNPRLVWMAGGIDPNLPLPSKTEITQELPPANAGTNVWGDQLYTASRRARQEQIVQSDAFHNRNGILPFAQQPAREKPAGFVGFNPSYRSVPYLVPTQQLDLQDWKPGAEGTSVGFIGAGEVNLVARPQIIDRCSYPQPTSIETVSIIPITKPIQTERGQESKLIYLNSPDSGNNATLISSTSVHTQIGVGLIPEESKFKGSLDTDDRSNTNIIMIDPNTVRTTLKIGTEQPLPVRNVNASMEGTSVYDEESKIQRPTLKSQMEQPIAVNAVQSVVPSLAAYDSSTLQVRKTLKVQTEQNHAITNIENSSEPVFAWTDTQISNVRPTLKTQLDQSFAIHGSNISNTGNNVFGLAKETHDVTLKTQMQQPFATSNVSFTPIQSNEINLYIKAQAKRVPQRCTYTEQSGPELLPCEETYGAQRVTAFEAGIRKSKMLHTEGAARPIPNSEQPVFVAPTVVRTSESTMLPVNRGTARLPITGLSRLTVDVGGSSKRETPQVFINAEREQALRAPTPRGEYSKLVTPRCFPQRSEKSCRFDAFQGEPIPTPRRLIQDYHREL